MKIYLVFSVIIPSLLQNVLAQNSVSWASNARFANYTVFFPNLMQETVYEIERRGWWNLNTDPFNIPIDETIYGKRFHGNMELSNGFVISIRNITLEREQQSFSSGIEGFMQGRLTFHDVTIGHDVYANLTEFGEHRFTGTYLHTTFFWELQIVQNLASNAISSRLAGWSAGSAANWMNFMPHTNISEIISRYYGVQTVGNSIREPVIRWGNLFGSIMVDLVNNKLGFPEICFSNC